MAPNTKTMLGENKLIKKKRSRSLEYAEFGHFTFLFCGERQRNVPRIIMRVHSRCSAHYNFCLVTLQPFIYLDCPSTFHCARSCFEGLVLTRCFIYVSNIE